MAIMMCNHPTRSMNGIPPPFETTIRDERIYARGISDDKGPSLIALEVLSTYLQVE